MASRGIGAAGGGAQYHCQGIYVAANQPASRSLSHRRAPPELAAARESPYRVFYDNIQKLWRDFNTVVLAFPPEHETYHQAGASFAGTVSSVHDQIAKCFEESECDYMVWNPDSLISVALCQRASS
jgi:hypothetical protein